MTAVCEKCENKKKHSVFMKTLGLVCVCANAKIGKNSAEYNLTALPF